jgi:drug/metabolite transporter (DMT)-like permease
MGWRFVIVAFLMVVLNPIVMLYGLRLVGSGLASVISAGTTPLSLLAFSVAARQERFNRSHLAALGLGVAGIALLFGPKAMAGHLDRHEAIGALCVLLGTLSYNAASVISRPLMRNMSPAEVAGGTNFCGGIALLILALLFEPGARQAASLDWGLAPWLAWVFLVLCSSIGATIIYLMLVRDWGASRTGTYAFVSPVIAVLLGVAVLGETLDVVEIMGMALMLTAAGLVLRRKQPG